MAARFSRSSAESRASVSRDDDQAIFARSNISIRIGDAQSVVAFGTRALRVAHDPHRLQKATAEVQHARALGGGRVRSLSAPRSWSVQTSRARSVNARLASSAAACCALSLADSYARTARLTEPGGAWVSVRARWTREGGKAVGRKRSRSRPPWTSRAPCRIVRAPLRERGKQQTRSNRPRARLVRERRGRTQGFGARFERRERVESGHDATPGRRLARRLTRAASDCKIV